MPGVRYRKARMQHMHPGSLILSFRPVEMAFLSGWLKSLPVWLESPPGWLESVPGWLKTLSG